MNLRIVLKRIVFLGVASAGAALLCAPAQAALSVIGSGPAEVCYQGANTGASPLDYLSYCDQALAGTLTAADRAATFVNRGVLKLAMKDVDGASLDFNSCIALNPAIGEAYVDRGAGLLARKRYAEAIADFDKGLALGTSLAQNAYYDRAMAHEALGNLKAAYDDYRQALTVAPDFTAASEELARFKIVEKPSGA